MATALKAVFWTFGGLLAVGTVLVLAFRQKPGAAGDTARWAIDQAETCWPRTRTKFNALDNSSKFWLGWGVAMVITGLSVAPGGFLLLCLGLAIGGVASVALHRNCPDLFAPRASALEMEAMEEGGGGAGDEVAVVAQLGALDSMVVAGILDSRQAELAKQKVLASAGLSTGAPQAAAAGGAGRGAAGGGAAGGGGAMLPRGSSVASRVASGGASPGVDTADVEIEPVASSPAASAQRSFSHQAMA